MYSRLQWRTNSAGLEVALFTNLWGLSLIFEAVDEHNVTLALHLGLFSLYLWLERAEWVERLPGVRWAGNYDNGARELYIGAHHGALWWRLWLHPDRGPGCTWRFGAWYPLGREHVTNAGHRHYEAALELPEGYYAVKVITFTTWTRRRWLPLRYRVTRRATVEIEDGVPIPGKELGEDAIFSYTMPANSVAEALEATRSEIIRDRGGEDWETHWPAHCVTR